MITNGRVQLWPFPRVALFPCRGSAYWRRLGLSRSFFLCVDVGVRGFAFPRLSHPILFAQASRLSDCCAFSYGGNRGLWRTTCLLEDYNVSYSDAPETYEAVVETQPVERERTVKCQLAVTKGRLPGTASLPSFLKKDYQYEDDGTGVNARQLVIGDGLVVCSAWKRRSG